MFNNTSRLFQENATPNSTSLKIPFVSGGTDFSNAFSMAYKLMAKYVVNQKIRFIFMTDGGAPYPSA